MGDSPAPAAGRLDDKTHVFPVRVYYEDTDLSGFVYHASYVRFMERGRSEFLRASHIGHHDLLTAGEPLVWVVRRMRIDFAKPARIEEALLVLTAVAAVGGARLSLKQAVLRGSDRLVAAEVEACTVTRDGRPRRLPETVRKTLEWFLVP